MLISLLSSTCEALLVSSGWSCPTWAGCDTRWLLPWRWGQGWSRDHCRTSSAQTEGGQSPPAAGHLTHRCCFSYISLFFTLHIWFYFDLSQVIFGVMFVCHVAGCVKDLTNLNDIWGKVQPCSREWLVFGCKTGSFRIFWQFPHEYSTCFNEKKNSFTQNAWPSATACILMQIRIQIQIKFLNIFYH